ncbi:MAG: RNA methyltransferase [Kiritimatiellales bacterium]
METITSVQNERVKRIAKLQRKASARRAEGLTVIEGAREVSRAIENGWQPTELWCCDEVCRSRRSLPRICEASLASLGSKHWKTDLGFFQCLETKSENRPGRFQCSENVFEKITYRENPDGVLAVGPLVGKTLADLELPENPLILVAEGLEKPGNLGALLRTADGAGANAVIVCDAATDLNNPNVIRASIGTLFYLPVAEATSEETVLFLKKKGVKILSAVPDAEAVYTDVDLKGPMAIVVGAEDKGLSKVWKNGADMNVKIPMLGKNDSLNVSVSAAILLYEAVRQRR